MPESCATFRPLQIRGRGECALHPRSRTQNCRKLRVRAYRAAEAIRHSLRNGFTAYNALSPENGSFASVIGGGRPAHSTPAPRRRDHTSLPYALAPFVFGTTSVHRNPSHVRERS